MPDKAALRAAALAARNKLLQAEHAAKSQEIVRRVMAMPQWANARTVMLYMPIHSEVDVTALAENALREGKRCLFPRCAQNSVLEIFAVEDLLNGFQRGTFGILEPIVHGPDCNGEPIDFILVPGAAFDRRGHRIGYGKGYYDRFLKGYREHTSLVAAAFSAQVLEHIPEDPYDIPVRWIATEHELISCDGGSL